MELLLLHSSFLLLLLLPSSQGLASTPTQGRAGGLHYQLKQEPAPEVTAAAATATVSAVMIGSRPPRCEGRCGRCEAVQVPVAPRDKRATAGSHFRPSRAFGVDESSTNYKPLNWRCRCADRRVLNP
uniref:Uncharacterized protein n=1 Tax=Avena sativa TaxID=4498 RepID=A0ACD6A8N8_AVESA